MVKEGMQALFEEHPLVGKLHVWQKHRSKYYKLLKLIGEIRREKYDQVIVIQRFASSGLVALFSGAKVTSGFSENPLSGTFTHRTPWHTPEVIRHETERNLALVKHLGIKDLWMPKLYPTSAARAKVQAWITGSYITVSPASLWGTKQYPEEGWVAFLDRVPSEIKCYLTGGKQDEPLAELIRNKTVHPAVVSLAGKLSLPETAVLMESAVMNYTNDSAPLHLASAMNAPVTAIFCSTVPAFGFGPLSDVSHIVETTETLQCRPCGIHGHQQCPEKHFRCALSINTQQLLNLLYT